MAIILNIAIGSTPEPDTALIWTTAKGSSWSILRSIDFFSPLGYQYKNKNVKMGAIIGIQNIFIILVKNDSACIDINGKLAEKLKNKKYANIKEDIINITVLVISIIEMYPSRRIFIFAFLRLDFKSSKYPCTIILLDVPENILLDAL